MADGGYTIDQLVLDIEVNSAAAQGKIMALAQALRGASPIARDMGTSLSQAASATSRFNKIMEQLTKETEQSGKAAKSASKGYHSFLGSIGRIAKLMVLRMLIRSIIKGIKEGVQMFVEWDRTSYGSMAGAANAMDNLKAAVNTLKGAFGAFAGQLLTALEPALVWVINRLTDLFNLLQQFIALLRGTDKWFKYVGGSASSAAESAKKLKNALFGFDELNVLPSASGGGSGSGVAAGDYEPTEFASWLDPIRKMFEQNPDMTFIEKLFAIIGTAASKFLQWGAEKIVKPAIEWVKEKIIEPVKTFFKETLPGWIHSFGEWFSGKWEDFKSSISDGVANIKEKLHNLWNRVPDKWRVPIENAYNTINRQFFTPFKIVIEAIIKSFQLLMDFITHPLKYWNAKGVETLTEQLKTIWNTAMVDMAMAWQETENSVDTGLEGLTAEMGTKLDEVRKEIDENPVMIHFEGRMNAKGFAQSVTDNLNNAQKQLNNMPLYFPSYVNPSPTGYNYNRRINPFTEYDKYAGGAAEGGIFPNTGTLFYAGEAGAEVVANMGHSTGVMNVSQMQEAVASGNAEVVNAVYAMANLVASAINNKDTNVYLDSAKVGQSVSKWQYNQARRGVTQGAY